MIYDFSKFNEFLFCVLDIFYYKKMTNSLIFLGFSELYGLF